MKLQKQLSRKVNGKEYSKFVITISPKDIKKLGWIAGENLDLKINNGKVTIKIKK